MPPSSMGEELSGAFAEMNSFVYQVIDMSKVRYRLKDNYTRFYLKYIEPQGARRDLRGMSAGWARLDGWAAR